MGALFYRLNRHRFSDVALSRWIQIGLLVLIGLAALRGLPGGWITALVLAALLVLYTAGAIHWRRRNYVRFEEQEKPAVVPAPLAPAEKLPVFVSGFFGVEGKYEQFTWLQGYYRTFATREHALLCLVQPSRFALLGSWPEKEIGMWYIFFKETEIETVRWGTIRHGDQQLPGLAVTHRIFIPAKGRFDRDRTLHKTAYIACPDREDAHRILADLLYDQHEDESGQHMETSSVASSNGAGSLPKDESLWRRVDG